MGSMMKGWATTEGTARYRARFARTAAGDHFTQHRGLWLSSVGMGTYLGEPDDADDAAYDEAARAALPAGCNVFDCAINYRFQRSERALRGALAALVAEKKIDREEFVVATKGGFIPFDGGWPQDPAEWIRRTFIEPGIARADEIVADCHCMAPEYIEHQFEASRANLGLETIDIYYLHNPETQAGAMGRDAFLARLDAAFTVLERKVGHGKLRMYGTATWDGYRSAASEPGHLSLADVLASAARAAAAAGARTHHFAAVQLPLNLAMPEALLKATQSSPSGPVPPLEAARAADLLVMASASILQGHLIRRMPAQLSEGIQGGKSLAQKAIQWVRSAPGVATALVGMKSRRHVEENLALAAFPRMSAEAFQNLLPARR